MWKEKSQGLCAPAVSSVLEVGVNSHACVEVHDMVVPREGSTAQGGRGYGLQSQAWKVSASHSGDSAANPCRLSLCSPPSPAAFQRLA